TMVMGVSWNVPDQHKLVSYYELARDEKPLTKVATGSYYFDTSTSEIRRYQVRSVDYDGQTSAWIDAVKHP
ncbi:MAG: hypothetical protein RR301_09405, partial [Clostridia bacterium]